MDKQEFIANKMKILVGKEGYSRPQAYAISLSMYEKEGQKAQQGVMFNQTLPPQPKYVMPNFNQLPDQGYDFSYNNTFNPQPIENNTSFGQFSASNYEIPTQINSTPQSFSEYNQAQNQVEAENRATNPYTTNSVNILPPTQFGNPAYNLKQGMYNFGRGNTLGGIAGTGASLLGMARIGLSGYAEGKEDKRVGQEYMDKTFDRAQNYQYGQQGGKIKNSDIIAQNAIIDQGQGNVNLEGNEFVMRTSGQVQPVVGDPHIKNGKKADGVDAQLNDGDKVLSNYVKLKPTDIKDVKERYNISVKKGVTFSEVQKELDKKLGIKKLETEKADILERIEKATKIKDVDSKQLSLEVLTKKTGEVNEKLNTLSGVRADNFEFLFKLQEQQPKKGDGTQLFDKNGKEVTESNEEVAQQGRTYRTNDQSDAARRETSDDTMGIRLRKIKSIQSGISSDKLGNGYYVYYDKLPTEAGFDPNKNREFITEHGYKNTLLRAPAYQEYMRSLQQPQRAEQLTGMQQGGKFTEQEKKIIQELVQKENIFGSFGDGHISKEGFEYGKAADYLAKPLYGVNYNRNEQILEEARRVVLENRAKRNNEIKSLKSSDSYIDNVKGYAKDLLGFQQGGEIETLAKKHGISIQRAQELVSMQQGGEQQEAQMQQIFQVVAEMLQKGMQPEQVAEQLVQMGVPEEQVGQLIQEVAQQMQGQAPQEQEEQEENEQEEMQQGGKKEYYEEGGKYNPNQPYGKDWTKEDQKLRYESFLQQARLLGYDGKLTNKDYDKDKAWGELQKFVSEKAPEEVEGYAKDTRLTAKGIGNLKNIDPNIFKSAGVSLDKANDDYSEQEAALLSEEAKKNPNLPKNFWIDEFNDSLGAYRAPMVTTNLQAQGVNQTAPQITAPSMARFASPQEEVAQETPETAVEQRQEQAATPSGVKNILPVYDTFLPPTSALEPIAKNTYSPYLYESKKMTVEPMLAEQARQTATDVERIQQSGLSPQQQEALMGQSSAANQMAANDAIYKTETYNADNAWKTDMANVDALNKSQIMNTQYLNDFAQKSAAALANKETERYDNAYSNFMQDQADRKYTDQMNKANMMSDQYALVPGQGIIALNNKPFEFKNDYLVLENLLKNGTPEEIFAFKKAKGLEASQGSSYNPSTNTELINNIYGNKAVVAKAKTKK